MNRPSPVLTMFMSIQRGSRRRMPIEERLAVHDADARGGDYRRAGLA